MLSDGFSRRLEGGEDLALFVHLSAGQALRRDFQSSEVFEGWVGGKLCAGGGS